MSKVIYKSYMFGVPSNCAKSRFKSVSEPWLRSCYTLLVTSWPICSHYLSLSRLYPLIRHFVSRPCRFLPKEGRMRRHCPLSLSLAYWPSSLHRVSTATNGIKVLLRFDKVLLLSLSVRLIFITFTIFHPGVACDSTVKIVVRIFVLQLFKSVFFTECIYICAVFSPSLVPAVIFFPLPRCLRVGSNSRLSIHVHRVTVSPLLSFRRMPGNGSCRIRCQLSCRGF